LHPKVAESDPWAMFCVDLVGPFTIETTYKKHSLLALTMIGPATVWFEIVKATNKSATSIQDFFHNTWLLLYQSPQLLSLTIQVLIFSVRKEDWTTWSEKFFVKAVRSGIKDALLWKLKISMSSEELE
jgi:hypothetical protein